MIVERVVDVVTHNIKWMNLPASDGLGDEKKPNPGGNPRRNQIEQFNRLYFGFQIGRTDFPGRSIYYLDLRDHYIGEK